jgi:hypothetical protein
MENKDQKGWEEDFDKRTNYENFPVGEYHKLEGNHLLDPEWYPESPYELDPEKIKDFIRQVEQEAYERGYKIGLADGIE